MNATSTNDRNLRAIRLFLERRGYRVLDTGWGCDLGGLTAIATDCDGVLVFVEAEFVPAGHCSLPCEPARSELRARLEPLGIQYLSTHPTVSDVAVRFDRIVVIEIGNGKSFVRHHIDALGSD